MKDKMMQFGVTLSVRNTRKQKLCFLEEIIRECNQLGLSYSFIDDHKFFRHVTNLVIGDIEKAKTVVMAYYDTPIKSTLFKYKYAPFYPKNNATQERVQLLIKLIIFVLVGLICYVLISLNENLFQMSQQMLFLVLSIMCATTLFVLYPKANKVNFNANSGAIAMLMHCVSELKTDGIAYVLYDKGCIGYDGLSILKDKVNKDAIVVILDSVATGKETVIACRNVCIEDDQLKGFTVKKYENPHNALSFFDHCIQISCGYIRNRQFYVDNTRSKNDYKVDVDHMNLIYETFVNVLVRK